MGEVIEIGACVVCDAPTRPGVDHCSQVCIDNYVAELQAIMGNAGFDRHLGLIHDIVNGRGE